jgi:hypothetical protein
MTKQHGIRSVVVALTHAAAVALCLSLSSPAARANDLVDCVSGWAKATLNPEQIKLALEFLTKHGECVGDLADPSGTFAGVVAAIVAIDAAAPGNLLSSAETCQQAIPNLLADVVEKVADSIGGAIGLEIPKSVKDKGHQAVVDWVNSLKDEYPISAISQKLDCGCAVAAFGKESLEKLLHDIEETAKACGGVIGDIAEVAEEVVNGIKEALEQAGKELEKLGKDAVELMKDCLSAAGSAKSAVECAEEIGANFVALFGTLADGVEAFLDALGAFAGFVKAACCSTAGQIWGGFCGGCDPPPKPTPPDLNCQGVICKAGMQCGGDKHDRCVACTDTVPLLATAEAGKCGCANGFKPQYKATPGGPILVACTCDPPMEKKFLLVTAVCACPHQGEVLQIKGGTASCGCPLGQVVQNGKCQTCKPWQKTAGGQCQDICPNGVFNDPNAPPPAGQLASGGPQAAQPMTGVPGQGGPSEPGAGSMVAAPSATSLPSPGAGAPGGTLVATPTPGLPGGAPLGEAVVATPLLLACIPCGANEYAANNQCHSCGPKAVVNVAARTCTPCAGQQVAKSIGGALTCAADCSKVGGRGKARPSTNYITDPKNKARCIACPKGFKPNDAHTSCFATTSIGLQPKKPFTATGVPILPSDSTDKRKKTKGKDRPKGTVVKISCPPRMHPNPSGTGCLPDIDMPDFGGIGSGPHIGPAVPRSRGR